MRRLLDWLFHRKHYEKRGKRYDGVIFRSAPHRETIRAARELVAADKWPLAKRQRVDVQVTYHKPPKTVYIDRRVSRG